MPTRDPVIALSPRERNELFDQTGRAKALSAVLVEKDYWVCWTLERLFSIPEAREHLIFKGGTSLSKVWGLIERFSEDIDISLSREWLGFGGDRNPESVSTRKQRDRLLVELREACEAKIRDQILPDLKKVFADELGPSGWSLEIDPEDKQSLLFSYPSSMPGHGTGEYVRRIVKIEGGARSDKWPVETGRVISFVAEVYPKAGSPPIDLPVLSSDRTFWEKATILHAEAHRPIEKATPPRFSRHYSDLAELGAKEAGRRALQRDDLRARVVAHKQVFFASTWASYDTAVPGRFKLVPSPDRIAALERDYQDMQPMFFKPPIPWADVIVRLRDMEEAINGTRR